MTRSVSTQLQSAMPAITRGDWNAFLALGTDNLAKFLILPAILIGTFQMPADLVYGRIMTGLSLTILVGLITFAYSARQLARKSGQSNATALPYGISTPVMFVYLFSIMGPVYFATNDPMLAYQIGLGAAFVGGLIEMSGALVGPWLQRITPRVGLLGTVAGVALVWIAVVPATLIFTNPTIGLPVLFITLFGLVGRYQFPFRLPTGLVALGVGVAIGLFTGDTRFQLEEITVHFPLPMLDDLWIGVRLILTQPELLAVIIPIEIYNFVEAMGNVESARAGGDEYGLRGNLLADGFGTTLGAVFGSPFPTSIYIGQPAYKAMGAGAGYAVMTGLFLFAISLAGLFSFLEQLIPVAAVAPLLVFIGLVMTSYAFQSVPPAHGAALVIALVPHIADLLKKQLDGTLVEVLRQTAVTPELVGRLADNHAVYLDSYGVLSYGAILTGLLWGAIVALLIDGRLVRAIGFTLLAAGLSLTGLIHSSRVGLTWSPMTIGYLLLAGLFGLLHLMGAKQEPADV